MNHDERHDLSRDERAALEELARTEPARPSAEAKERARAAFLRGDAPAMPSAPPRASVVRRLAWIPAAAAILFAVLYGARPSASWIVTDVSEPACVQWDAEPPVAGVAYEGGRIRVAEGCELGLSLDDGLQLRIREGSDADLPRPPGRWFGRGREIRLRSGEVYGSSGLEGLDFDLTLVTPEATAKLLGTTFAVFRTDDATCFCLFRGGLEIRATGSEEILPIEAGQRIFIYKDGRDPEVGPLDAGETMKLQMIDDAAQGQ